MNKLLIFTFGAALGSVVTWALLKERYEKLAKEDAESLREYYSRKEGCEPEKAKEEVDEVENQAERIEYENIADIYTGRMDIKDEGGGSDLSKPYIIKPEEFGDCDYDLVQLNYYADGVVADDWGEVVSNIGGTIGIDFADHFGENGEADAVYVRNDKHKIDYEVVRDLRDFADLTESDDNEYQE